jgi:hypothetical protein
LSAISLGLEAIRNQALRGWSELRPLERQPRICQALCRWIPPVSSQRPAQDRGCRIVPQTVPVMGQLGHRRATGPSVVTYNQAGGTRSAHPQRTQFLSITMLCSANFVNANFTILRENWSKSLTALGKKIPRNLQIAPLRTQHEVEAVSKPTCTGRPGLGDLVTGVSGSRCACPYGGHRG